MASLASQRFDIKHSDAVNQFICMKFILYYIEESNIILFTDHADIMQRSLIMA